MQETLVKYLAGLLDADGCLCFHFSHSTAGHYNISLVLTLVASKSVDREGSFLRSLPELTGLGRHHDHGDHTTWVIGKRNELEQIVPRLCKHMVIKAKHWDWLLRTRRHFRGAKLSFEDVESLKKASKESRKDTGPLSVKKHATMAWTCGFLEGDGCFSLKKPKGKGRYRELNVRSYSDDNDPQAAELLMKSFGGHLYRREGMVFWRRNLGPRDKSFAIKFLKKMIRHSHLKKWKMERMLEHLYNYKSPRAACND